MQENIKQIIEQQYGDQEDKNKENNQSLPQITEEQQFYLQILYLLSRNQNYFAFIEEQIERQLKQELEENEDQLHKQIFANINKHNNKNYDIVPLEFNVIPCIIYLSLIFNIKPVFPKDIVNMINTNLIDYTNGIKEFLDKDLVANQNKSYLIYPDNIPSCDFIRENSLRILNMIKITKKYDLNQQIYEIKAHRYCKRILKEIGFTLEWIEPICILHQEFIQKRFQQQKLQHNQKKNNEHYLNFDIQIFGCFLVLIKLIYGLDDNLNLNNQINKSQQELLFSLMGIEKDEQQTFLNNLQQKIKNVKITKYINEQIEPNLLFQKISQIGFKKKLNYPNQQQDTQNKSNLGLFQNSRKEKIIFKKGQKRIFFQDTNLHNNQQLQYWNITQIQELMNKLNQNNSKDEQEIEISNLKQTQKNLIPVFNDIVEEINKQLDGHQEQFISQFPQDQIQNDQILHNIQMSQLKNKLNDQNIKINFVQLKNQDEQKFVEQVDNQQKIKENIKEQFEYIMDQNNKQIIPACYNYKLYGKNTKRNQYNQYFETQEFNFILHNLQNFLKENSKQALFLNVQYIENQIKKFSQ